MCKECMIIGTVAFSGVASWRERAYNKARIIGWPATAGLGVPAGPLFTNPADLSGRPEKGWWRMAKVSLTLSVIDDLIGLLQALVGASIPPEIPPVQERDEDLNRQAEERAAADLARRIKAQHGHAILRPNRPHGRTATARSREQWESERRDQIRKESDQLYRELEPELAAESERRRAKAKELSKELQRLLMLHRPAIMEVSMFSGERNAWSLIYVPAGQPGEGNNCFRDAAIQDFLRMRFALEKTTGADATCAGPPAGGDGGRTTVGECGGAAGAKGDPPAGGPTGPANEEGHEGDPPDAERSPAYSLAAFANALDNIPPRSFKRRAQKWRLRRESWQMWTVRLDLMDKRSRQRIESMWAPTRPK